MESFDKDKSSLAKEILDQRQKTIDTKKAEIEKEKQIIIQLLKSKIIKKRVVKVSENNLYVFLLSDIVSLNLLYRDLSLFVLRCLRICVVMFFC
jgi:hypothetical protein